MPRLRDNYAIMTVTIDQELKTWLSRGLPETSRSDANEQCVRAAYEEWKRIEAQQALHQTRLDDAGFFLEPEVRARFKVRQLAAGLYREIVDHKIMSNRVRCLKYELRKLIQELRDLDE